MPLSTNMSGLMQPMGQRGMTPPIQGGAPGMGAPGMGAPGMGAPTMPGGGHTNAPEQQALLSIPIQPGDTLSDIARRYNTTVSTLQYMNGIKNPDMIFAGSKINVPNPNYSPIQKVPEMANMLKQRTELEGLGTREGLTELQPMAPFGDTGVEPVMPEEWMIPALKATGVAGMAAAMPGALTRMAKAAPVVRPNALGTPNLAAPGFAAAPAARGAAAWPGAKPTLSNVRPVSGSPEANAAMIMNMGRTGPTPPVRMSPTQMAASAKPVRPSSRRAAPEEDFGDVSAFHTGVTPTGPSKGLLSTGRKYTPPRKLGRLPPGKPVAESPNDYLGLTKEDLIPPSNKSFFDVD